MTRRCLRTGALDRTITSVMQPARFWLSELSSAGQLARVVGPELWIWQRAVHQLAQHQLMRKAAELAHSSSCHQAVW
jgi:hypothetical protein